MKVWLASSGLVLGGESPSPRFTAEWRSWGRSATEEYVSMVWRGMDGEGQGWVGMDREGQGWVGMDREGQGW